MIENQKFCTRFIASGMVKSKLPLHQQGQFA
jgi:hypothetical protein